MTDSYRLPHNIIKLRLPDGRVVSMIQDQSNGQGGAAGHYGESVEVWVDGEPSPIYNLSWQQLVDYVNGLQEHEAAIEAHGDGFWGDHVNEDDLADWAAEDDAIFLNEDRLRQGRQQ